MRTGLLVVITILAAPLANQVLPGTGGHTFAARAQSVEGRIEDRHKFENPRVNGQVVDRCLNSTSNCEQPAADNFCRLNGYAGAVYFRLEYTRPTLVVADNKVCNDKTCQGFTAITCANERHFDEPQINGRAVDRCLNWGQNCEQPAADNFCRLNGYARAASFRFADMRPTVVAGDDKVCDEGYCQGFTTITCEGRGEHADRGGRSFVNPRINGKLVDRCLNWGENCEQPAADNFCRQKGFSAAAAFEFANVRPTLVVGDNKVCNENMCQGFTTITCR
ncbi:MAG: hypothetical protein ABSE35_20485 [Bryobacteraceae bacterium]|jgi:hypothetical protein